MIDSDDSILIIGNGKSILNYKFGSRIDKFKNIIRINNYQIINFECYIGTKTTIWSNGANQKLKKRIDTPPRIIIFIPPNILNKKSYIINERIKKRLGIDIVNYELISADDMLSYEKACGCKRLTTGTSTILWAFNNYKKVIIHGFDFFEDGKDHYYDNKFKSWISHLYWFIKTEKHNIIKERKKIQNLLDLNKIYQLKNMKID